MNSFYRKDGDPLYLAGFYDRFKNMDRFVIPTTTTNASVSPVYHRMPLILEKDQICLWLCDEKHTEELLHQIPVLLDRFVLYEQQRFFWENMKNKRCLINERIIETQYIRI